MIRLNLISSPRNISTALMYSFAQRSDTSVVDEPFYGYYLLTTGVEHPGRDEIIRSMITDPRMVVDRLLQNGQNGILFIKNMAHHLIDIEERFFRGVMNIFLIRNPKQLIASLARVIPAPTMTDIGVRKQHELFSALSARGKNPVVLDSGELLRNPRIVLTRLCAAVGIGFEEAMLSWVPGPRPEDGIWAGYWYGNVHRSSGFEVQATSDRSLPDSLMPLWREAEPLFQTMLTHAIRAED